MQTITITKDFLASKDCTAEIMQDIATRHCEFTPEEVTKFAKQGKLLHNVNKYLANADNGYAEMYKDGTLQLDIAALPDPVAPKQQSQTRKASATLTGPYKVVNRNGCKAPLSSAKWQFYNVLFACNTYEQYFAQCKEKGLTAAVIQGTKNAQLKITAAEFARWATKCKWIVPVETAAEQPAEVQQAQEQPAAEQPAAQ
jgi:hypothetical protein